MKDGGWIPVDKRLVSFLPKDRAYTELEAVFSLTKDIDEHSEKSIRDYARMWSWSRQKVNDFMGKLRATNKPKESQKKADRKPPFRLVYNNLQDVKSQKKADEKPKEGRKKAGTIDPDPNPEDKTLSSSDDEADVWVSKKGRELTGKREETFKMFWDAFAYKVSRAEAIDAWLDIPNLTMAKVDEIVKAAKAAAENRPKIKASGGTPKMAQGWLSGSRWEDEREPEAWRQNY